MTGMVEPYGGGAGFRFKVRNVQIDGRGDTIHVRGGGSHEVGLEVLHDCPECGNAVNQVIVGLAGQDLAQASVWNGKQRSGGGLRVVNPGTRVEALAEDNRLRLSGSMCHATSSFPTSPAPTQYERVMPRLTGGG